jgi:hypothetical protein
MLPFLRSSGKCRYFCEIATVAFSQRNVQILTCMLVCRTEHIDINNQLYLIYYYYYYY